MSKKASISLRMAKTSWRPLKTCLEKHLHSGSTDSILRLIVSRSSLLFQRHTEAVTESPDSHELYGQAPMPLDTHLQPAISFRP